MRKSGELYGYETMLSRAAFGSDKEYAIYLLDKAIREVKTCRMDGLAAAHEPDGEVRHVALCPKKGKTLYVMVKGLGPFEAVEKIIKEAKLK